MVGIARTSEARAELGDPYGGGDAQVIPLFPDALETERQAWDETILEEVSTIGRLSLEMARQTQALAEQMAELAECHPGLIAEVLKDAIQETIDQPDDATAKYRRSVLSSALQQDTIDNVTLAAYR